MVCFFLLLVALGCVGNEKLGGGRSLSSISFCENTTCACCGCKSAANGLCFDGGSRLDSLSKASEKSGSQSGSGVAERPSFFRSDS